MKVLELFAGTRSIGKAFEERGHEVYSIEWNKDFENIDWYADIGTITANDILERFGHPDVIWASPDCTTFSVAAISKHRRKNEITGSLDPISDYAKFCDEVDKNVIKLIKDLNPKYYFIENPRGGMRKMEWMQDLPRYTVTYCHYETDKPVEERRMKPTDIWTNHPNPEFLPPCKNGDPCHARAPRGARTGTQAIKGARDRSIIPAALCNHIVDICERGMMQMSINFFDFEIFAKDWLVVIMNPINQEKTIIVNDVLELKKYHEKHKDDIWIGYNSRNYDSYILKAILLGFNPKEVNDWIIVKGRKGWEYSSTFNKVQLYNYDCMSKFYSLKQLEGFMGNNIKETEVSFNLERKLTPEEINETIKYCIHDVEQTMEVFIRNKADFDAHMNMLKTFGLPMSDINRTQVQLSAKALGAVRKDLFDEWEYSLVDTLRINKYKHVIDWFMNPINHDYSKSLTVDVCGVPHQFGWGGLHGAPDKPIHRKGLLIHVDVTSYYPSLMIKYDFLSRNVRDKSVFKQIYDTRVALKKAGKKKEQAPYKIIINGTYGASKDPTNPLYDPRQANNVCVNGQLLLLDLLEHLEGHCELIQSNTDGLIIQIPDTDEAFNAVDDICYEWEQRTGMGLGFDTITEIWQKDVNNYIFRFQDGRLERKGAYVKELSDLDYDLPIINTALVDYMTKKIPIEQTIMQCNELKQFQKIVKISSKYICGWHNDKKLYEKTFRVFASKNHNDSFIGKVKMKKDKEAVEKFANTPEHCFIENGDVNEKKVPDCLDKQYYIELAEKRLKQFGM